MKNNNEIELTEDEEIAIVENVLIMYITSEMRQKSTDTLTDMITKGGLKMNHDEILKFIKDTERDDDVPQRTIAIGSDDILNLRIALNENTPDGIDPLDYFLNRV